MLIKQQAQSTDLNPLQKTKCRASQSSEVSKVALGSSSQTSLDAGAVLEMMTLGTVLQY